MNDQLKLIVERLNTKPFNRNFNLISFDSLNPEQLQQILTDVLSELDSSHKIDIRTEEPETTTMRIMGALRVLRYKPKADVSPKLFRQGLVQGDKQVLHPILEWLLQNLDDLRKRAFLAQYLVKIEVPLDILADADTAVLYEQVGEQFKDTPREQALLCLVHNSLYSIQATEYEHLIEEFKQAHKETENMKNSGFSTSELKSDMEAMEKERDILLNRIQQLQRKVESAPNHSSMLAAAHALRVEREREKQLLQQRQDEVNALSHREQRFQRLQQQLKDLRASSVGATPQGLLQRLEEEVSVNTYIAKQKLPREIEALQKEIGIMSTVLAEPIKTRIDLDELNAQIQAVNTDISQLVQRHLAMSNPADDKLAPFRQQAAIIARKKETTAEHLSEMHARISVIDEELQEKQNELHSVAGDTVLRGEDFKRYVNKLRGRSSVYKRYRSQLSAVKAESGVLMRTFEILQDRIEKSTKGMTPAEIEDIMKGQTTVDESEEWKDSSSIRTSEELAAAVQELNERIANKKATLAPIIKDMRPLREKCQDLTSEYDKAKQNYDSAAAGFDSSIARLEQNVRAAQAEQQASESQCHFLQSKCQIFETDLQRVAEEMKNYVKSDSGARNKKSMREQLMAAISEQEKFGRQLKEEQRRVQENKNQNEMQRQLWTQLHEIMELKSQCMERAVKRSGVVTIEKGAETLVLQS